MWVRGYVGHQYIGEADGSSSESLVGTEVLRLCIKRHFESVKFATSRLPH
jgi:hypothetical protein